MFEPLKDPAARMKVDALFDALAEATAVEARATVRVELESMRWEALNHAGHPDNVPMLRGFIFGLSAAGTLDREPAQRLNNQLTEAQRAGWM